MNIFHTRLRDSARLKQFKQKSAIVETTYRPMPSSLTGFLENPRKSLPTFLVVH